MFRGEAWIAEHQAMPFGATASVLAWHRVGKLLTQLANRLLHLPVYRYVDDYFAADRCICYSGYLRALPCILVFIRPGLVQSGLRTFVRLVRALLGPKAIADAKTEYGQCIVILGIQVQADANGAWFNVCPKKAQKWAAQISEAIATLHLDGGSAQKLAGRLNFATQHLFHRLGRAMIKPIYGQETTASGKVGPRLLEALEWWLVVLRQNITEHRRWATAAEEGVCRLFVDAASTPPKCAAVLCIDGRVLYTDLEPSQQLLDQLAERKDKQITSLVRSSASSAYTLV
jgi:hypothetical protein